MSQDKNIIDQAAEIAGTALEMNIRDGELCIAPADAGILLLAAVAAWQEQADKREEYIDKLEATLEKVRDENGEYRELLEDCRQRVIGFGYEEFASRIMNALWPIVGVLEDGTEVAVEINWAEEAQ